MMTPPGQKTQHPAARRITGNTATVDRPIAAGVGGTGGSQALAWAAGYAARTGMSLVLLHIVDPGSPLDRSISDPTQAEVELIDPPLAHALTTTQARLGGHRAILKIRSGEPSECLTEASAGARLLVIGAGTGGHTVRQIVRHAHCPVVVVRPSTAATDAPFAGHIVVGVDGSAASRTALDFAVGYAADNGLPLAALHVAERDRQDRRTPLADEMAPWARAHPSMPIRCVMLRGSVTDHLIRASAGAYLLVLGDKRRGVIGRARTGDVPLTVVTEALCPVAIVALKQRDNEPP